MAIKKIKADIPRKSYNYPDGGTINWREVERDPPGKWPGINGNVETQQIINKNTCGSKQTVMGRSVYNPGAYHEPHLHFYAEELMFCLSGRGVVGGLDKVTGKYKEFILCEGDVQFSPIGEVHWLRNPFNEPVEFIWIYSGANIALESGYATPETFEDAMELYNAKQDVE